MILQENSVCGYIRLTKQRTESKEKNEISIAIAKKFQDSGIGSFAYSLFEKEMRKKGVKEIIALTSIRNEAGQRFFEKNGFVKSYIRYLKKI